MKTQLPINPGRLLQALSMIGYSPTDAILDIVDNSVSAGALEVSIDLEMDSVPSPSGRGRPRIELKSITIRDNGEGMDKAGLVNALALGSSTAAYTVGTLSKFGLGLKSAAGSLGEHLTITSKKRGSDAYVSTLDMSSIDNEYEADIQLAGDVSSELGDCGTAVKISQIRVSLPIAKLKGELSHLIGMTYQFFMGGDRPVVFSLNGERINPVDPLFEAYAGDRELDNPDEWDGLLPSWIVKPTPIQIDGTLEMEFRAVMMPHPPLVGATPNSGLSAAECRDRYFINAQSYGIYIYRNGRLIARADSLDGLVARDQDLYSFRGRLDVQSDSDEALFLNVQKSRIQLSNLAREQLGEKVQHAIKNSRNAWQSASRRYKELLDAGDKDGSSKALDEFAKQDIGEERVEEQAVDKSERARLEEGRNKVIERGRLTEEEQELVRRKQKRVLYETLPDNRLWARRQGTDLGVVCIVNEMHRLCRDVLQDERCPVEVRRSVEYLLFIIVMAEAKILRRNVERFDRYDEMFGELSETVGDLLSALVKDANPLDPPAGSSD